MDEVNFVIKKTDQIPTCSILNFPMSRTDETTMEFNRSVQFDTILESVTIEVSIWRLRLRPSTSATPRYPKCKDGI